MLAPDPSTTEQALQSNAAAATAATNYAQATLTAVPPIRNAPDWFAPIQSDLTTAQTHARQWLITICPGVTGRVPQGIVDFAAVFRAKSASLLQIQQAIFSAGGSPTAEQRANVDTLLGGLSSAIATQQSAVALLQSQIAAYSTAIKSDQDALANDLGNVSARFASGGNWVQQLTATIGESFLQTTALGPCTAIVQIDMNISLQIGGIMADPTVIALVFAKAILENQLANAPLAEQAVQAMVDTWGTVKAKADAVAADLHDAQDSAYLAILSQIDLETAATQWQQLADYASKLIQQAGETRSTAAPQSPTLTVA